MKKPESAGILLFKRSNDILLFFLVHPGGPFWKNKDIGAWSIPKGEFTDGEESLDAAKREFKEETGKRLDGDFIELTPVKLKSGKTVFAWALEDDMEATKIECETMVQIEWPPKSGRFQSFPEVDKGEWFTADVAKQKINPSQVPLINELIKILFR